MSRKAQRYSSFITPFGLYQYKVLPFGLTNAPSTFQRMMNNLLGDLTGTAAYLDDVVVVADDWDEHVLRLHRLFQRLQDAGLTIQLKKSVFGRGSVTYLGHIVGGGCVRPKEANIEAVLKSPNPEGCDEVSLNGGLLP